MSELLTSAAAARILNVTPASVRLYERTGKLAAQRTSSGIRLFKLSDVETLKDKKDADRDGRAVAGRVHVGV